MKSWCRVYQFAFRAAQPLLPYRDPKILDSIVEIPPILKELGIDSVLVVTDKQLSEAGLSEPLEHLLKVSGFNLEVYGETQANPTVHNIEGALKKYHEGNCQAIVAFGGGSSMDCAKATGARVVYPKRSVNQMKGLLRVLRRLPPLFAIPTTAGTGSEVTVTAVITDSEKHHKYTMNNFTMIPRYAVLDPKATETLPKSVTATTGMDALTHAVEAYIGGSTTKETRSLALEATKLVFENIEAAYQNGSDLTARSNMLHAAHIAGIAFSKSYVGYIHAVAHSLGGQYGTPHGLANAVLMPIGLELYGSCVYKKLWELGRSAGVVDADTPIDEGARAFIEAIKDLNRRLNIPEKLAGIKREDIPTMARHAAKEANPLYPVPKLMDARELEEYYEKVADWSEES